MKTTVNYLQQNFTSLQDQKVVIEGWIKTNRDQKEFGFISFNDGSDFVSIQIVYDKSLKNFDEVSKFKVGCSLMVEGVVVLTPTMKQPYEIKATQIMLLGDCPDDFPIQPKRHTREFLREQAHLRPRTNIFAAVFRVRSIAAMAIHQFFQERRFVYFNAPLITANDGEGAGEMFQVTTLDFDKLPRTKEGEIDYSKDFFGKKANLTVTGQLEAEAYALALRNVYTFGPTFRAENSNTQRHASEFWMIEPEMAFADLEDDMNIMEEMVKYIIAYVLEKAPDEIKFFDNFVEKGLLQRLQHVVASSFVRITHEDAITILKQASVKFDNDPKYGEDLATEHEKYLTEVHFKSPVFVTNWPKDIKAFYMRLNDDLKTVAAVDLLVPGSGELCGGSQREERLELLQKRMQEIGISEEGMEWYLELRKFGGCKHSGFGMGFERLIMYLTGIENIRDVIPFPRTPKNCEF